MRKLGIKIILFTVLLLILSGYFEWVNFYVRLTLGVFFIGTGITLIFVGGMTKFKDLD